VNDACEVVSVPPLSGQSLPEYWALQPTAMVLNVKVWSSVQAVSVMIRTRIVRQQKPFCKQVRNME
jgi:hypothetical protein